MAIKNYMPYEIMVLVGLAVAIGVLRTFLRRRRQKKELGEKIARAREQFPKEPFEIPDREKGRFHRWNIPDVKGKGYYHKLR